MNASPAGETEPAAEPSRSNRSLGPRDRNLIAQAETAVFPQKWFAESLIARVRDSTCPALAPIRAAMSHRIRKQLGAERGSSLVGTLVSLIAVAVLAIVLLPSLMGGSSKQEQAQVNSATAQANDVQATSLLGFAQTAMATYQASGNGYAGATPQALHSLDPEIAISGPGQAYLEAVSATTSTYTLVAYNPLTGNTFTLADNNGALVKTCTVAGRGGCQPGGTW